MNTKLYNNSEVMDMDYDTPSSDTMMDDSEVEFWLTTNCANNMPRGDLGEHHSQLLDLSAARPTLARSFANTPTIEKPIPLERCTTADFTEGSVNQEGEGEDCCFDYRPPTEEELQTLGRPSTQCSASPPPPPPPPRKEEAKPTAGTRTHLREWKISGGLVAALRRSEQSKKPYVLLCRQQSWQRFCLLKCDLEAITRSGPNLLAHFIEAGKSADFVLDSMYGDSLVVRKMNADGGSSSFVRQDFAAAVASGLNPRSQQIFILEKRYNGDKSGQQSWRKLIDSIALTVAELTVLMGSTFTTVLWESVFQLAEKGHFIL